MLCYAVLFLQFRLQEPAVLKLVQQIGTGPPDTLASSWQPPPAILFLNKQDKLDSNIRATVLQQLRTQLGGLLDFQRVFVGAAMRGEGVDELKDHLLKQVRTVCNSYGPA
jgi:GTPase Era involved in 16S rRNA processing